MRLVVPGSSIRLTPDARADTDSPLAIPCDSVAAWEVLRCWDLSNKEPEASKNVLWEQHSHR